MNIKLHTPKSLKNGSSVMHIFQNNPPFLTAKSTLEFCFIDYAVIGNEFFFSMQQLFSQCKEMMDVSDEEIETYQKEREKIKNSYPIDNETREKRQQEIIIHPYHYFLHHHITSKCCRALRMPSSSTEVVT